MNGPASSPATSGHSPAASNLVGCRRRVERGNTWAGLPLSSFSLQPARPRSSDVLQQQGYHQKAGCGGCFFHSLSLLLLSSSQPPDWALKLKNVLGGGRDCRALFEVAVTVFSQGFETGQCSRACHSLVLMGENLAFCLFWQLGQKQRGWMVFS